MSKHLLGVVAVCVLGMLMGPVLAQEEGGERRRRAGADRAREGAERRRPGGDRARASLERLTTALKLTEKQQAPVEQALETYRKEMANWTEEKGPAMRELYQQARQARQDGKEDEVPCMGVPAWIEGRPDRLCDAEDDAADEGSP